MELWNYKIARIIRKFKLYYVLKTPIANMVHTSFYLKVAKCPVTYGRQLED